MIKVSAPQTRREPFQEEENNEVKELKQLRKAGLHVVEYAPLFRWGYFVFAYSQEH